MTSRAASAAADVASRDAVACAVFTEAIRAFGIQQLKAGGRSMQPAIWPGDRLIIQAADSTQVSIGDVVAFRRGPAIVAHRVVAIRALGAGVQLVTRGDRLSEADEPIAASAVLGRVILVRRGPFRLNPARPVPIGWRTASALFETAHACRRQLALACRYGRTFARFESGWAS